MPELTATILARLVCDQMTARQLADHLAENFDAVAAFVFVRHGAQGEAYRDIVASGPAAMNAHHRAGPKVMQDGELVLMDYCPDLAYYRCDITRQWPVNGKFSEPQRDLYTAVLNVQRTCVSLCRESAGFSLDKLHEVAENSLNEQLKLLGFDMSCNVCAIFGMAFVLLVTNLCLRLS